MTEKQKTDTTNFTWGANPHFAKSYLQSGDNFNPNDLKNIPRILWDNMVGVSAGLLNIPADISSIIPNKTSQEFSTWWENNITQARNSLQSNELLKQRELAQKMLNSNTSLKEVITNYPEATLSYLTELGIPTKAMVTAGMKIPKYAEQGNTLAKKIVGNKSSRGYGLRLLGQLSGGAIGAGISSAPLILPAVTIRKDLEEIEGK